MTTKRRKIKLFGSDSRIEAADEKVSKWIESNPGIEIEEVKIAGCGAQHTHYMVAVTYLE